MKLPQTVPDAALWIAKGITRNFERTDEDLARIRAEVESLQTSMNEIHDMLVSLTDDGPADKA